MIQKQIYIYLYISLKENITNYLLILKFYHEISITLKKNKKKK